MFTGAVPRPTAPGVVFEHRTSIFGVNRNFGAEVGAFIYFESDYSKDPKYQENPYTIVDPVVAHSVDGTYYWGINRKGGRDFLQRFAARAYYQNYFKGTPHFYTAAYNADSSKTVLIFFRVGADGGVDFTQEKELDGEVGSFFPFRHKVWHSANRGNLWYTSDIYVWKNDANSRLYLHNVPVYLNVIGGLTYTDEEKGELMLITLRLPQQPYPDHKSASITQITKQTTTLSLDTLSLGVGFTDAYNPSKVSIDVVDGAKINEHVFVTTKLETFRLGYAIGGVGVRHAGKGPITLVPSLQGAHEAFKLREKVEETRTRVVFLHPQARAEGVSLPNKVALPGPDQELLIFQGIASISVLKASAHKFYLALGDPTDNSNTGKAVVFEMGRYDFSDVQKTFEVEGSAAGDWFGWSVKLQLLDRDGGGAGLPEPVLFVGAPKAKNGKGSVEVFDFKKKILIQTLSPEASLTYVRAFGYSLGGGIYKKRQFSGSPVTEDEEEVKNYLLIGAPASVQSDSVDTQDGAAFVYKWNNGEGAGGATVPGAYELKGVARPATASHITVGSVVEGQLPDSATVGGVDVDLSVYNEHFGASVGFVNYDSDPYLYVVSYNSDRTGTAISAFQLLSSGTDAVSYGGTLSKVVEGEYGAFFTLPIQAWEVSYFEGSAQYKWFLSETEADTFTLPTGSLHEKTEKTAIDVLGFLVRGIGGT